MEYSILIGKSAAVMTLKDGCRFQPVLRDQSTVTSHSDTHHCLSTQIRALHSPPFCPTQVPKTLIDLTSANSHIVPQYTPEKNYSPIPALNMCPILHLPISKISPSFLMRSEKFCFMPFMWNSLVLKTREDRQMRVQHPLGSGRR